MSDMPQIESLPSGRGPAELGVSFNFLDSFGNQIWKSDPNPRSLAKAFLQLLAIGNKAGVISEEQTKLFVSELANILGRSTAAVDHTTQAPLPMSFEEAEKLSLKQETKWREARDRLTAMAPLPDDEIETNPIQDWVNASG